VASEQQRPSRSDVLTPTPSSRNGPSKKGPGNRNARSTSKPSRKGKPSPAQTQARIAAVLEAARDEFSQSGYHGAKMDSIAARAGVSKRSLYLWYSSKAELFRASVLDGANAAELPKLDAGAGFKASMNLFAAALLGATATAYGLRIGRLLIFEGRHFPDIAKSIAIANDVFAGPVRDVLLRKGLSPKKSSVLAQLFVSSVLLNVQRQILLGVPLPSAAELVEHRELIVEHFICGLPSVSAGAGTPGAEA